MVEGTPLPFFDSLDRESPIVEDPKLVNTDHPKWKLKHTCTAPLPSTARNCEKRTHTPLPLLCVCLCVCECALLCVLFSCAHKHTHSHTHTHTSTLQMCPYHRSRMHTVWMTLLLVVLLCCGVAVVHADEDDDEHEEALTAYIACRTPVSGSSSLFWFGAWNSLEENVEGSPCLPHPNLQCVSVFLSPLLGVLCC